MIDPCQHDGYGVNEELRSESAPVDQFAARWFATGLHRKTPTGESATPYKSWVRARSPPLPPN